MVTPTDNVDKRPEAGWRESRRQNDVLRGDKCDTIQIRRPGGNRLARNSDDATDRPTDGRTDFCDVNSAVVASVTLTLQIAMLRRGAAVVVAVAVVAAPLTSERIKLHYDVDVFPSFRGRHATPRHATPRRGAPRLASPCLDRAKRAELRVSSAVMLFLAALCRNCRNCVRCE